MSPLRIKRLARRVKEYRADRGVREAAGEVGVSPATLSRVENGKVPDLETFSKICRWLDEDPAIYLGLAPVPSRTNPTTLLSRIERLERLLAHVLDEVQPVAREPTPPWVRTLWDAMHNDLAEIDRGKGPAAPVEEPLDARKLAYDFLILPFPKRLTILRGLGLLTEEETRSLANSEAMQLAFRRAKERNLLGQLRAEIDRERGEG